MTNRIRLIHLLWILLMSTSAFAGMVKLIPAYTVTYPKGKIGGSSSVGLPAPFVSLPPAREYVLDYQVRFHADFDWVKGGKLPGLVGGTRTSGCDKIVPNGWSARFMWKEGGEGNLYLYHQNRRSGCGDSYPLAGTADFAKNLWTRVTQRVVINTPGRNDGLIEVWINGTKRLTQSDLQLRGKVGEDVALVDAVSLQTFYGGSTSNWAPPKDNHADFSELHVLDSLPTFDKPFTAGTIGLSRVRNSVPGVAGGKTVPGPSAGFGVDALGRNFPVWHLLPAFRLGKRGP